MPKYQNIAIEEEAFLQFTEDPSDEQLSRFVDYLGSNSQANSFFYRNSPIWHRNPTEWAAKRLSEADWYAGLSEPEMVAWEHAIMEVLDSEEFEYTGSQVRMMEHGAVDFDVFEFAAEALEIEGRVSQVSKMFPYRFHGLPLELQSVDPVNRVFSPNHALLDTRQIAQLIDDIRDYPFVIREIVPRWPSEFESIEERRENAIEEANDLIGFLSSLLENNLMWFARIDC